MTDQKFIFLQRLTLIMILSLIPVTLAQAQSLCEVALNEAEQKYRSGDFSAALILINRCLIRTEATAQDKVWAYKLLGKVHIAQENPDEAKKAFALMLRLSPETTLDPTQETPEVMAIFNEVKAAFEKPRPPRAGPQPKKKGGSKKWIWIGAGGVAAVGATAILLGGGGGNGDGTTPPPTGFPLPPGRPR